MVIGFKQEIVSSTNLVHSAPTKNHLLRLRASQAEISIFGTFEKSMFPPYFAYVHELMSKIVITFYMKLGRYIGTKWKSLIWGPCC